MGKISMALLRANAFLGPQNVEKKIRERESPFDGNGSNMQIERP